MEFMKNIVTDVEEKQEPQGLERIKKQINDVYLIRTLISVYLNNPDNISF